MIILQKYYRVRYTKNRLKKCRLVSGRSNTFNQKTTESKPKSTARRRVVCSAASAKDSWPDESIMIQKVHPLCDGNTLEDALGKYVNMPATLRDKFLKEHIVPEHLGTLQSKNPMLYEKYVDLICRVREDRKKYDYIENSSIIDLDEYFRLNPEVKLTKNYIPFTIPEPLTLDVLKSYLVASPFDAPMFSKPPSNPADYVPFVAIIIDVSTGLRITVESKGISRYQEGHVYVQGSGNHYIWYQDQKLTINQYIKAMASIWPRFLVDFDANPESFKFYILKIGSLWVSDQKRLSYVEFCNLNDGPLSYVYSINSSKDEFDVHRARKLCLLKGHSVISVLSPIHIGSYKVKGSHFPGKEFASILEASAQTNLCVYTIIYRAFSKDYKYNDWFLIQDIDNINQNMVELDTVIKEKEIQEINQQKSIWYNRIKTVFYLGLFIGHFVIAWNSKAMQQKANPYLAPSFPNASLVIDRPSLRGNIAGTTSVNNRLLRNTQSQTSVLTQANRDAHSEAVSEAVITAVSTVYSNFDVDLRSESDVHESSDDFFKMQSAELTQLPLTETEWHSATDEGCTNFVVNPTYENFVVNPMYEPSVQGSKSESFQKQSDALTGLSLPETEWHSVTEEAFVASLDTRSHPIVDECFGTEYEEIPSKNEPLFETFTFFDTYSSLNEYVKTEDRESQGLQNTVPQTEIVALSGDDSCGFNSETIDESNRKVTYRSILSGKISPIYGFDQEHPGEGEIDSLDRPSPPMRMLNVKIDVDKSFKLSKKTEIPMGLEVESTVANYPKTNQVPSQLAALATLFLLQRQNNVELEQKELRDGEFRKESLRKAAEMLDNVEKQGENNPQNQNAVLIAAALLKQTIELLAPTPVVELYTLYSPYAPENMAIRQWWLSKYAPLQDCIGAGLYVIVLCVASANPFLYFGETIDFLRRGKEYAMGAKKSTSNSRILRKMIKKYGLQNFAFIKIRGEVSVVPGMTAWALNFVEEANRNSPDWKNQATRTGAEKELIHFYSHIFMPHEGIDRSMSMNIQENQSPQVKLSNARAKKKNPENLFMQSVQGNTFKDNVNKWNTEAASSFSSPSLQKEKTTPAASELDKIISNPTLKEDKIVSNQTGKTKKTRAASEPNKIANDKPTEPLTGQNRAKPGSGSNLKPGSSSSIKPVWKY